MLRPKTAARFVGGRPREKRRGPVWAAEAGMKWIVLNGLVTNAT